VKIHFTSDHHFGDAGIFEGRNRPFTSLEEMQDVLMQAWIDRVKPDDKVYHLGDLMTYRHTEQNVLDLYSQLPGRKILLKGNHDHHLKNDELLDVFEAVHEDPFVLAAYSETDQQVHKLWLCHYPIQRNLEYYTLTGHIHELWKVAYNMLNVGVDQHRWAPVSYEDVLYFKGCQDWKWDANVYPDAALHIRIDQSNKVKRPPFEPTEEILRQENETNIIRNGV
jgi:calcineurin-like phosphoesterase family protein